MDDLPPPCRNSKDKRIAIVKPYFPLFEGKGNQIRCKSKTRDIEAISEVCIGESTFPFNAKLITPSLVVTCNRFEEASLGIGESKLESNVLSNCGSDFRTRALAIFELAELCCSSSFPKFEFFTQTAAMHESDSGDEETLIDREVSSPFSADEVVIINLRLKSVWETFALVQYNDFHNAQGKYFIRDFCELARTVVPHVESRCYISTNPSAPRQPGYAEIIWKLDAPQLRSTSEDQTVSQANHSVPDFIMFNVMHQMVSVVAEVKSGEGEAGGLDQNMEQMLGLWKSNQVLMLGLVLDSGNIHPRVLRLVEGCLVFENLSPLQFSPAETIKSLRRLMELVAAFNFITGPN